MARAVIGKNYRIAAKVANAAWRVMQESETSSGIKQESWLELRQALSLYSPGNFPPLRAELEAVCRALEETYDWLTEWAQPDFGLVIMEKLFERILAMRVRLR